MVQICRATLQHLDRIVPLFDAYRQFYGRDSDLDGARAFLTARIERDESVILLAGDGNGFTQLYPCFSSVRMRMTLILNDLFVAHDARGQGVGAALLEAASAHALYLRAGWERDAQFHTYTIAVD